MFLSISYKTSLKNNMALPDIKIKELEAKANAIRLSIIEMLIEAGSGHTAGPLGMADIFTYLYHNLALEHRSENTKLLARIVDYFLCWPRANSKPPSSKVRH